MATFLKDILAILFFFNIQAITTGQTLINSDVGLIVVGQILREEKEIRSSP